MKTITMYKTVRADKAELLDDSVNKLLDIGFQPYGNPYFDGQFILQAMVADEDFKNKNEAELRKMAKEGSEPKLAN